ncbi:MAG: nucleotidyl transferase AbiEii/AbiGii toxin family protein [Bacteroidota bacterium]|nr:nucleotidyl transferase AbiEii/AbiGii toxin family protein [Bacteroidota bacterium]
MLYSETVNAKTLDLIKELMEDEQFKDFVLVGGTSLSLQIGHRKSIDIDLFTDRSFNAENIKKHLQENYIATVNSEPVENSVKATIDGIRIDIMSHQFPTVKPIQVIEGIRLSSMEDIAAMKLNVITRDGTRLKDYIDMYCMLEYKNLNTLCKAFVDKYPEVNAYMAKASLIYHDEIDFDTADDYIIKTFDWQKIKERLTLAVKDPERIFVSTGKKFNQSLDHKLQIKKDQAQNQKQLKEISPQEESKHSKKKSHKTNKGRRLR